MALCVMPVTWLSDGGWLIGYTAVMCCRCSIRTPSKKIADYFGIQLSDVPELFVARYNIASHVSAAPRSGSVTRTSYPCCCLARAAR
jgi:hypothetical protein